jgi:hypothetical protein
MLVQLAVDHTIRGLVHGIQDYHLRVCEAMGIDPVWYQGMATRQNSLLRTTPLERGSQPPQAPF